LCNDQLHWRCMPTQLVGIPIFIVGTLHHL